MAINKNDISSLETLILAVDKYCEFHLRGAREIKTLALALAGSEELLKKLKENMNEAQKLEEKSKTKKEEIKNANK